MKDGCHGLPPSRAKGGHTPGTSPDPTGNRLLLGPVTYATKEPTGHYDPGTVKKAGLANIQRDSGWPPTSGIAWIRSGKRRNCRCVRGTVAGDGVCLIEIRSRFDGSK